MAAAMDGEGGGGERGAQGEALGGEGDHDGLGVQEEGPLGNQLGEAGDLSLIHISEPTRPY